ncbi:response regulator [Sphingomonas limnosediminicola]|jgi:two-component sensor histidine kinase|uniref:histidine kinase n=1 Tax=Sphingomonas limnosediminicola TaxID=940133 RepID=A0ABP7LV95_9SPHN
MHLPRRILYVDDDAGTRRLVEKLLGRRGHNVVPAESGAEAVSLAQAEKFDLIAVDHYMPGMDGLETLGELRKIAGCPPVVYVTGSEESSVAVAALKAGAYEYVVKSTGDDFVDLLERAFAHALQTERLKAEKAQAESELRAANERLGVLLREVNHRVANSLQIVSTMIGMQARVLPGGAAREALDDTQRRIDAIAQVHRNLYASDDVQSVAVDQYFDALITELQHTWSTPAAPRVIRLSVQPFELQAEKAVSLGVIVNELVSNACKYAYSNGAPGEVRVELGLDDERHFRLLVEDDGQGMEAGAAPRGTGMGSKLIAAMARSLSSELVYDPSHAGVRATLRAPV